MKNDNLASTQRVYIITQKDLPLCCPMPSMQLWNAHPRVYLPIQAGEETICPYCSAKYVLVTDSDHAL